MYQTKTKSTRELSFGEEVANAITHAISTMAVLVFIPIIAISIYKSNSSLRDFIGIMIFLASIFMMFLMSTLYHAVRIDSPAKLIMQKMDHIFIFVAIAGSYTPIALSFIYNIPEYGVTLSIALISLQWLIVILGTFIKIFSKRKISATIPLYMVMGWILIFMFPLFIKYQYIELFWFILAGGLFYSLGVIFFAFKQIKYTHMYWHFCVSFGALLHIIGICFYLCLE